MTTDPHPSPVEIADGIWSASAVYLRGDNQLCHTIGFGRSELEARGHALSVVEANDRVQSVIALQIRTHLEKDTNHG